MILLLTLLLSLVVTVLPLLSTTLAPLATLRLDTVESPVTTHFELVSILMVMGLALAEVLTELVVIEVTPV